MPSSITCPSCEKSLSVPDGADGKSVRCPACSHRFKVPSPPPPDEEEVLDLPDDSPPVRPQRSGTYSRAPQHTGGRVAVLVSLVVVVVIVIGGGAVWLVTGSKPKPQGETERASSGDVPLQKSVKDGTQQKSDRDSSQQKSDKDSTAERDRDYMMVLDNLYELAGLANGAKYWLKQNLGGGFNDLRGPVAANVMVRAFDPSLRTLEAASVENRKLFLDWNKMDSKAWRPEFIKRYPERELIQDEIAIVVDRVCTDSHLVISTHLVNQYDKIRKELNEKADMDPVLNGRMARNGTKIIEDEWHEYRMKYLEKEGPKLVEEVRSAVKKMDSVVGLKKKVEAAAPSRTKH